MVQQGNILEVVDVLNVLMTTFAITLKTIWFVVKVKKVLEMKQNLEELLKQKKDEELVKVQVHRFVRVMKIFYLFGFMATFTAFAQFCIQRAKKELPYKTWFYWDYKTNDYLLWSLAVYQYVVSSYLVLSICSSGFLPLIFIGLTTAAIDELCHVDGA
jgi:hypothetical protein